jgi:hypothetical protein
MDRKVLLNILTLQDGYKSAGGIMLLVLNYWLTLMGHAVPYLEEVGMSLTGIGVAGKALKMK